MRVNINGIVALVVLTAAALGSWALGAPQMALLFAGAAVGGAALPTVVRLGGS